MKVGLDDKLVRLCYISKELNICYRGYSYMSVEKKILRRAKSDSAHVDTPLLRLEESCSCKGRDFKA